MENVTYSQVGIKDVVMAEVEQLQASLKGAEVGIVILSVCLACLACGFAMGVAFLVVLRRTVRSGARVLADDEDEPRPVISKKDSLKHIDVEL